MRVLLPDRRLLAEVNDLTFSCFLILVGSIQVPLNNLVDGSVERLNYPDHLLRLAAIRHHVCLPNQLVKLNLLVQVNTFAIEQAAIVTTLLFAHWTSFRPIRISFLRKLALYVCILVRCESELAACKVKPRLLRNTFSLTVRLCSEIQIDLVV